MFRLSVPAAVCVVALSLGCFGGGVNPEKPREFVYDDMHAVPAAFQDMNLPWYGGQIERQTPNSMAVSYSLADGVSKEWLVAQWSEALAAEGWVEATRTESGNGDVSIIYTLPDGKTASIAVETHAHQVWWVTVLLPNGGAL